MASLVAETWAYINGDDDSNGVEISKYNCAFLMSLLEESHGEDYNDEQINRVIRSLEAEINANTLEASQDDSAIKPEFLATKDAEDGQNCLASMEIDWADMELAVPSSPSDDMNWYMEHCGNEELDVMVEYGEVSDYSQINYDVVSSEEHGLSTLWHETNDAIPYY